MRRNFMAMLAALQDSGRFLCLGLDSRLQSIPEALRGRYSSPYEQQFMFNSMMISQTHDRVCAYMADGAFYLKDSEALRVTAERVRSLTPQVPFILGGYGGGVKHVNDELADFAFNHIGADAIIVNPYPGMEGGLETFLDFASKEKFRDKGVIVICRTSNPGVEDFQDALVGQDDVPLWRRVAWRVSEYWNKHGNCALMMGPASHGELAVVRSVVKHMPIFVTGIGTQGRNGSIVEEDVEEIMVNGRNPAGKGVAVCASRSVIFSAYPRVEAEKIHGWIEKYKVQKPQQALR